MGRTLRRRKRRRKWIEGNLAAGCYIPASLIQWSLKNKLVMCDITPKLFHGSGRGIKTSSDIHPPKVLITVPPCLMITFDNVWDCQVINDMLNCKNSAMKAKDAFMLYLLIEKWKGDTSFYYYYIANLPTAYSTPSYITKEEAKVIPIFLSEEVERQKKVISDAFKRITAALKFGNMDILLRFSVSRRDVRWAWNVINTRSVFFDTKHLKCSWKIDVSEVNFALLPILDLLNHKDTANINVNFNENKYFEIITNDYYKCGDQVYINYGPHSNRALLCEYGFILQKNMHSHIPLLRDTILTLFKTDQNEKVFEFICNGLTQIGVNLDKMCITRDGFDWSFITAAHAFVSSSTKIMQHDGFHIEPCDSDCVIRNISQEILLELINGHNSVIKKMEDQSSPILLCIRHLLELENEMMQVALNGISSKCLLD